MSDFILRVRTSGPAFRHCPTAEIGRILRRLADDLDRHRYAGAWPRPLHDSDGAHVGQAKFVFASHSVPDARARQEPGEG
jgi:hypothetical protein